MDIIRRGMSVDLARTEKQKYLREHILDKGYETEKFVSYMQGLRGGIRSNN